MWWPFKKKDVWAEKDQLWKVEYVPGCRIEDGKATFDLGNMREEFVATGPLGSIYDAAAAFVKTVGILPHGYIHQIRMVKRIPRGSARII